MKSELTRWEGVFRCQGFLRLRLDVGLIVKGLDMISLYFYVTALKFGGSMSGENGQLPSKASGMLSDGGSVMPDEEGLARRAWGGTMWLALVREIAQTVDDDYAVRPYPVKAEVRQAEEAPALSPEAAEAVPSEPEVGAAEGAGRIKPPPAPWGPLAVEKHARRRRRRSRSGRREGRAGGRRWLISLWVSLFVVVGGVWLIMRDGPKSKAPMEEEFPELPVPEKPMASAVAEEARARTETVAVEAPPPVRTVDINSLALAQADSSWEMAEGEWMAEPVLVRGVSSGQEGGVERAGPVVTPVEDGSRPAPSAAFITYAATLKITSVAWGKRVRATINGARYIEDAVLEPELGVRLVGRDPVERALIFEGEGGARVKVSY